MDVIVRELHSRHGGTLQRITQRNLSLCQVGMSRADPMLEITYIRTDFCQSSDRMKRLRFRILGMDGIEEP